MLKKAEHFFYGLLYVDDRHNKHTNLKTRGVDPADIYLKCAALCASSMAANEHRFQLVTNDAKVLRRRSIDLGLQNLDIIEHSFKWTVPTGIPFYSAHFKLELFEAFGTGYYGPNIGLIDIDTVLCRPLLLPPLSPGSLLAYDISDQSFPVHGAERVRADLERVAGKALGKIRWFGGEFLLGDTIGFRRLSELIAQCWPRYTAAITEFHHVSDEMTVSAALNIASENGQAIVDAGPASSVIRWWSARTGYRQRPFRQARNHSLLHLPADKVFLSEFAAEPFEGSAFLSAYEGYVRKKLIARNIYNELTGLLGRPKKFVGTI
ncbi:MAG: hypothetical protein WCB34_03820 [Methylovirgula sp.]